MRIAADPIALRDKREQRAPVARRNTQPISQAAVDILLSETIEFILAAGLSKKLLASQLHKEARRLGAGGRLRKSPPKLLKRAMNSWLRSVELCTTGTVKPRTRTQPVENHGAARQSELRKLIGKRFPRHNIPPRCGGCRQNQ